MSYLQKYVRQIKPVREDYLSPVDMIQNILSEATMSIGQLNRRDNIEVLKDLINNQKPNSVVYLTDGRREFVNKFCQLITPCPENYRLMT